MVQKSSLKQDVAENTLQAFAWIKESLVEITKELSNEIKDADKRLYVEYKDRGKFEAQLRVAGDILIFSMHSNIFCFNREHSIWKIDYLQENPMNAYCGIINIYNFLSDSFKYGRMEDLGYLIGRIFINRDMFFTVEGKRQFGFQYQNFGKEQLKKSILKKIINTSVDYTLKFDLLVPPYDAIKIISIAQMTQKIQSGKMQTAKRLGFTFNSDDVIHE